MRTVLAVFLLLCVGADAVAERPTRTDDPAVVGRHRWEATIGAEWEHGTWTDGADRNDWRYPMTVDYGFTDRLELGAKWDGPRTRDPGQDGAGDVTFHTKAFISEGLISGYPDFAVDLQVKLPTASRSKGLGTGETDLGVHALWGWRPNQWGITARIGRVVVGGSQSGLSGKWEAGLAVRREIWPGTIGFVEYTMDTNEREAERSRQRAGIGLRHDFNPSWAADVRAEAGLSSAVPDGDLAFGLTYRP